ncbi:MAG TPA: hypothetical protein VIF15_01470 [Polyangiaceae bacterium]|jgi:hypothetical protein
MNKKLAATVLVVGAGALVALGVARNRQSHPHPMSSASSGHGAEIDRQMAAVRAFYVAQPGATPCETAYNAFKASQDLSDADKSLRPVVTYLAPHDDFVARCQALPPATQQCVAPVYMAQHRAECLKARPDPAVMKTMADILPPGEPSQEP